MNLNDEYLPYKHIIGQVILDVSAFRLKYSHVSTRTSEKQTYTDGRQQARFDRHAIPVLQDGASSGGAKLHRRTRRFIYFYSAFLLLNMRNRVNPTVVSSLTSPTSIGTPGCRRSMHVS